MYLLKHNAECLSVHVYWSVNSSFCEVWSAVSTSAKPQLARVGVCTLWMSQCGTFNCSVLPLTDCVLIEENFSMKCKKHKVSLNDHTSKMSFFLEKMDMLKLQGFCATVFK